MMDTELFTDWARGFEDGAGGEPMKSRDVTYCEGYEVGVIAEKHARDTTRGGQYLLGYAHGRMATTDDELVRQMERSDDPQYIQGVQDGYVADAIYTSDDFEGRA